MKNTIIAKFASINTAFIVTDNASNPLGVIIQGNNKEEDVTDTVINIIKDNHITSANITIDNSVVLFGGCENVCVSISWKEGEDTYCNDLFISEVITYKA